MSDDISVQTERLKRLGVWIDDPLINKEISLDILKIIPRDTAAGFMILPVAVEGDSLQVVTSASYKQIYDQAEDIKSKIVFDGDIRFYFCERNNLLSGLAKHYDRATSDAAANQANDSVQDILETEQEEVSSSEVVKRVNDLFDDCIETGSSDLHIHPHPRGCRVFFRKDNRLNNMSQKHNFDPAFTKRVIGRIKSMCEKALSTSAIVPEDGLIAYEYNKNGHRRKISLRVSTYPFANGEKVVIRFLDTVKTATDIDKLGYLDGEVKIIKRATLEPTGLYMVVGPVNTGKSTTLAAIRQMYDSNKDVTITMEDPIEYRDENIVQVEIRPTDNEKTNLDYAVAAKHALRQDFNNLFIGEMRNGDVAKEVVSMSLYGRRVFTTLHAEDVLGSFGRLADMGVNVREFVSQLRFVLSQRLIAVNCKQCLEEYVPDEVYLECLPEEDRKKLLQVGAKRSRGDTCCNYRGYESLTAVGEILLLDDDVRDMICRQQSTKTTLEYLKQEKGFKTMYDKAFEMVLEGKTTLEELVRYIPRH